MTIGQLRYIAELSTLQAFVADEPSARIVLLRIAQEATNREEAVARWRGQPGFQKFVPPLHALAEGKSLSGRDTPAEIRSPMEKRHDDATISEQRFCA